MTTLNGVATATEIEPVTLQVLLLLWGWPQVLAATGIPRRTLEQQIAAGNFPKPIRRVGRRPYWKPNDVIRWAGGDE